MPTSIQGIADALRANVSRVIVGKEHAIDLLLVALLSDGHVLLEDVPGIGKTLLAKALARSLDFSFQRIQGTPDLLPADITGISYYDQQQGAFLFRAGPLFAQLLLFDEINRTTPRTQSALLEAMAERQVTTDRETRALPRPFCVLATQNPVEMDGTYPLPEAQLDRFLLRLPLGYPDAAEELAITRRFKQDDPLETLLPVATLAQLLAAQQQIRAIHWEEAVEEYGISLIQATRQHPAIEIGASPRATLALFRACEALAAIQGRDYVLPDDIKALAIPVLAHRIILTPRARLSGQDSAACITELLASVPTPVEAVPPAKER